MSGIPSVYNRTDPTPQPFSNEGSNIDLAAIFRRLEFNQDIFDDNTFNTAGTTTMLNEVKRALSKEGIQNIDQYKSLSSLFKALAPQGNQLYSKVRAHQMGFKGTDYPQIDASDDLQTQINRCRFYKDDSTVKLATLTKQGRRFYWVDRTTKKRVNLPDHFNRITWRQSAKNAPDHLKKLIQRLEIDQVVFKRDRRVVVQDLNTQLQTVDVDDDVDTPHMDQSPGRIIWPQPDSKDVKNQEHLIAQIKTDGQYHGSLLNPANAFYPGGGYKDPNHRAMEENLCYESNLWAQLVQHKFNVGPQAHLPTCQTALISKARFLSADNSVTTVPVVSIASPDLKPNSYDRLHGGFKESNYEESMKQYWRTALKATMKQAPKGERPKLVAVLPGDFIKTDGQTPNKHLAYVAVCALLKVLKEFPVDVEFARKSPEVAYAQDLIEGIPI